MTLKILATLSVLVLVVTGCDNVQHGRFVTSGNHYCPFSSPGGIIIVEGSPTTPIIGGASGDDQNLLYVIYISPKIPRSDTSGSIVFGKYVTTLIHTLNDGTSDLKVLFAWNRQDDTIAVGTQKFSREHGNVFVVQLDVKRDVVCRQLTSLGSTADFQQVLEHARQQLPNDEQIRKLTLKISP